MKEQTGILIIDDDPATTSGLKELLERSGEYLVHVTDNGRAAMKMLHDRSYDIVLLDLKMPGCSGMDIMQFARKTHEGIDVVIITGYGSIESAVECLKKGAYDYLTKPIDIKHFRYFIQKIVEKRLLASENVRLRRRLDETREYQNIVGTSPLMQDVFEMVNQVSKSDVTVLLCGESGTGKELIAHEIHHQSACCYGPFLSINCGALPKDLFESELFGYEKGAFTGAYRAKRGAFELADGGTLFLDEIGEMNIKNQVDMLRILEEGSVRRLGSSADRPVNVRIVAATNKELEKEIQTGAFRKDLFYRINIVSIHMPPLRERMEDLPLLVSYFLGRFSDKYGRGEYSLSTEALEVMMTHTWPGNIRELKNCLERAVILSKSTLITPEDLPRTYASNGVLMPEGDGRQVKTLAVQEKKAIIRTLSIYGGHQKKTAAALGISERTLRNKIKLFGLKSQKRQ